MHVSETELSATDKGSHTTPDPVSVLIELLENGDEAQRCYSARALISTQAAQEGLANNLYHEDPDVVIDCANALFRLGLGNTERLLEVAQYHPDADARLAAMDALASKMSDEKVQAFMLRCAGGRAEDDILTSASEWDDWWDIQLKAVEILVNNSRHKYLPEFLSILDSDPEPELESRLYQGIVKHDVDWIIDHLADATLASKRKLIKSLFYSSEQIARVFLFKHLQDEDPIVRKLAVEGLTEKRANEYFWDIVQLLKDTDSSVQKAAMQALKGFSSNDEVDQLRLINYIELSERNARPQLFELLARFDEINSEYIDRVIDLLRASPAQSLINATEVLVHSCLKPEQTKTLLELYLHALDSNEQNNAVLVALIRKVVTVQGYDIALLERLQSYVHRMDERTQECHFSVSVRQAAFDVLAKSESATCRRFIKLAVLGSNAYPDAIDVNQIEQDEPEEPDGQQQVENQEGKDLEAKELETLLGEYEERVDLPLTIVNTPNSTLGAITQANLESDLGTTSTEPDQQQHIVDMVDELDDALSDYAQLVKDNFDSADELELNRKKVVKLPTLPNKILAIKSLGASPSDYSAALLLEAVLGSQPSELREIFHSLQNIKKAQPDNSAVDNGLGAAGNIVYHGDDLTKQSAAGFLSVLPAGKAIPLLLHLASDSNSHVRFCAFNSLESHIDKIKLNQKEAVTAVIRRGLSDSSGGVKAQALRLAALYPNKFDISLSFLIDVAIDDEECLNVAQDVFANNKASALQLLAEQVKELRDHHQPNAIKLMGLLLEQDC